MQDTLDWESVTSRARQTTCEPRQRQRQIAGALFERVALSSDTRALIKLEKQKGPPEVADLRAAIKDFHSGNAPKVRDPFAGGGAIPLEAMRLGCQATSSDLNPVAWFIQRGTLDYPQRFAGKRLTDAVHANRLAMAWNWPRNSPETIGALSAGKLGSRIGVGISAVWLVRPSSAAARPRAQARSWARFRLHLTDPRRSLTPAMAIARSQLDVSALISNSMDFFPC